MAQPQLLFAGTYDNLDNAWAVPAAVLVGSGTGVAATSGCFFSGPGGCVITDIYYVARDLTITDPNFDVYLAWRVRYSSDGGASLTTLVEVTANADLPLYWDDSEGDYGDFTLDYPLRVFSFYGAGTGDLVSNMYGTITLPANVHVTIEVAPYLAGSVKDMPAADLDSLDVLVYGYLKG